MDTAVAIIIFNRLDTVRQLMEVLRLVKPNKIYVISDASREDRLEEEEKVQAVRSFVEQEIDWDCVVKKNYAERNMGCHCRIVSGLDWVFENEEKAIILEDDIVPSLSFFTFCDELLSRYEKDTRIMQISGYNPMPKSDGPTAYFFSYHASIWGWATWRRAWSLYDDNLEWLEEVENKNILKYLFPGKRNYAGQMKRYRNAKEGKINSWAYRWHFTKVIQSGLGVVPRQNMIKNVGFGESATHTTSTRVQYLGELSEMQFPMCHPEYIHRETPFDLEYQKVYNRNPLWKEFLLIVFPLELRHKIKRKLVKWGVIRNK